MATKRMNTEPRATVTKLENATTDSSSSLDRMLVACRTAVGESQKYLNGLERRAQAPSGA